MNSHHQPTRPLVDWMMRACAALGVECLRDFRVGDGFYPIFLPNFGGQFGMVIATLDEIQRPPQHIYFSKVNPDVYSGDSPLSNLQEALNDWGWYGEPDRCPVWFTGFIHAAQPVAPADGFAAR